jgi:hypothetical protein
MSNEMQAAMALLNAPGVTPSATPAAPVATPETPEAPKAPTDAKLTESTSQRFAALARREQQLVKERQAIAAEKTRIASLEAKIKELTEQQESIKQQARLNPRKALEYLGTNYEDITNHFLKGEAVTPELVAGVVEEKLTAFQKQQIEEREAEKKAAEEAKRLSTQAEADRTINEFKSDLRTYLDQNKDKYELISLYDSQDAVYETIEQYFAKEKKILSADEAAEMVEKQLEELAKRLSATEKYGSLVTPAKPESKTPNAQPRTIDNSFSAQSSGLSGPAKTEAEAFQRALAHLNNS